MDIEGESHVARQLNGDVENAGGQDGANSLGEWYEVCVPILEWVRDNENELLHGKMRGVRVDDIASAVEATPSRIHAALNRLFNDGFVTALHFNPRTGSLFHTVGGGPGRYFINGLTLTGNGARVIGEWPLIDPYKSLLELLEERISTEPNRRRRAHWKRIRHSVQSVGESAIGGLVTALMSAGAAA